ncbi:MAG: hypothetical protein ACRDD7_12845 [Peptostreptococcaceae bacterium]
MTHNKYQNIKLNYSGLVAVEFKDYTTYQVGDIYRFDSEHFGVIIKQEHYKDYEGCKESIVVKLK